MDTSVEPSFHGAPIPEEGIHGKLQEGVPVPGGQNILIFLFSKSFICVYFWQCCVGCFAQAFSSWGTRGLLFIVVHGLLIAVASLFPVCRL